MTDKGNRASATIDVQPLFRQKRLADRLYEQILEQIVSGKLEKGARLPSEAEFCRLFQVSRSIVREALSRLQADGLVRSRQGSGTFVQQRPSDDFMKLAAPGSIADVLRCYELRICFESEAAGLAAQRRTKAQINQISSTLKELERITGTSELGIEADVEFHKSFVAACGNHLFVTIFAALEPIIKSGLKIGRGLSLLDDQKRLELVFREHARIYDAIRDGEPDAAAQAVRAHFSSSLKRILSDHPKPIGVSHERPLATPAARPR